MKYFMLTLFRVIKEIIYIDLLENDATVNSSSNWIFFGVKYLSLIEWLSNFSPEIRLEYVTVVCETIFSLQLIINKQYILHNRNL